MMRLNYFSSISFFLVLNAYQLQVNALLAKETMIAIDTGHTFMSRLENKTTYTDVQDLIDDLKRLSEIYCNYKDQNKILRVHPVNFLYRLSRDYHIHFLDDYGCDFALKFLFNETISAKELASNRAETFIDDIASNVLTVKSSIHENDYNLKGDLVWGDALNNMHKLIATAGTDSDRNPLELLTKEAEEEKCYLLSRQQLLLNHFHEIAMFDAKAYVTMQFHYAFYEMLTKADNILGKHEVLENFKIESALWKEKNLIKKMKSLEKEFLDRNTITANVVKAHVNNMSRDLWNCNVEHKRMSSYESDSGVKESKVALQAFQKYVINEADLNSGGSCSQNCPYYKQSKDFRNCYDEGSICSKQRQCEGNVWDCQKIDGSAADICLRNQENSWERYQYMKISGKEYGQKTYGCTKNMTKIENWPRFFYKCDYCMCNCESKRSDYDRYFNLRHVESDAHLNYVVTGARFQMHNHIVHIQIQQGKLAENGSIQKAEWKPVDNYTIDDEDVFAWRDYYEVSSEDRTICLDELDSSNISHVITGLRFKSESEKYILHLKLEIRLTPFDYKTGRLAVNDSYWHSNNVNIQDRKELKLEEFKSTNMKSDQYLRFTASPLEIDAGQATIPFIDTAEVVSYIPVPLSGAGIFLAKNYTLAFKALTYDIQSYL